MSQANDDPRGDERLSRIVTHWSRMFEPQGEILRYYGAVYRYFMGIVRNPAKAEELTLSFAERFLQQHFQERADPQKGRFRDLLKTSLRHMAADLWRRERAEGQRLRPLPAEVADLQSPEPDAAAADADFDASCRAEWLSRAWQRLAAEEQTKRTPYATALRFKVDHPDMRSAEMAARLSEELKISLTAESVRTILKRAREKFADFLLEEVLQSLPSEERGRLEDELIELKLLDYCRSALDRRKGI